MNQKNIYEFGPFRVDAAGRTLLREGKAVALGSRAFDTLVVLIRKRGEVVPKDDLLTAVWRETSVEEGNLSQAIFALRRALGEAPGDRRYIVTVPGRGYSFVGELAVAGEKVVAAVPPSKGRAPLIAAGMVALLAGVTLWLTVGQPSTPLEIRQRQLTTNSIENPVVGGAISPDGKYLAYADAQGVHTSAMEAGETQTFTLPDNPGRWDVGCWYPDSTRLLAVGGMPAHPSIWTLSMAGGAPRKLRDDAYAVAVSPDGGHVGFVANEGRVDVREIWVMDSAGGNAHPIMAIDENSGFRFVAFSPDFKRVGYVMVHETSDRLEVRLEVRNVSGGPVTTLYSEVGELHRNSRVKEFVWLPGDRLIVSSPSQTRHFRTVPW
jgi:DNA-binding winged helix-turn-helix (wHTH) protein